MALTQTAFSAVKRFPPMKGGHRHGIVDITLDDDYEGTGGWEVTAANLGLKRIWNLLANAHIEGSADTYIVDIYKSSDTSWYVRMWTALGTELADENADLDAVVLRVQYWGS
jgi:hypothetical protein